MSEAHALPEPTGATRMHEVSPEMLTMIDRVIDYSRRRLIFDVPLDKPLPLKEFRRLAPGSICEEGIGSERALSMFEGVLAPACVSTAPGRCTRKTRCSPSSPVNSVYPKLPAARSCRAALSATFRLWSPLDMHTVSG